MAIPYYNVSYGSGFEGIINYAQIVSGYWFVAFFLAFILIALIATFSKDQKYPISAIVAFSLVVVLFGAFMFKLVTSVNESIIYLIIVGVALAIGYGIWQGK